MDIYLGINGHANTASLPLRMGIRVTERHQQFATLESATHDELGTNSQRQDEIAQGRRHYRGTLVVPKEGQDQGEPYRLNCRVVLGEPKRYDPRPPVITVLRSDFSKGDLTVTKHIEEMLRRGQITPDDLIQVFHPAYINGQVSSSNDCEEIFRTQIQQIRVDKPASDATVNAILSNPIPVATAIAQTTSDSTNIKGPPHFRKLPISGVKYEYQMVDAYIEDVRLEDDMIRLNCIDSKGHKRDLHSFKLSPRPHLAALHKYAFDYLSSRQEQRAIFAICDSEPCKGFLAESVTAIALQLMKTKVGSDAIEAVASESA